MPSQTSHGSIYRPLVPQRTVTDTAYTLVREDAGSDVNMDSASACTITVPTVASCGFEVGEYINIHKSAAQTQGKRATTRTKCKSGIRETLAPRDAEW